MKKLADHERNFHFWKSREVKKMFNLIAILIVVLAVALIVAVVYIVRLSKQVNALESKNPPATEIHVSQLDEESVKEA